MDLKQSFNTDELISFSNQKIALLKKFLDCLQSFTDNLNDLNEQEILSQLEIQKQFSSLIDELDLKYQDAKKFIEENIKINTSDISEVYFTEGTPRWIVDLSEKTEEQKQLLSNISVLNNFALSKAYALYDEYKNKTAKINKRKIIINNYYDYNKSLSINMYTERNA